MRFVRMLLALAVAGCGPAGRPELTRSVLVPLNQGEPCETRCPKPGRGEALKWCGSARAQPELSGEAQWVFVCSYDAR